MTARKSGAAQDRPRLARRLVSGRRSFALPQVLEGKAVVRATLRLFQTSVAITTCRPVVVDHLDLGTVLDATDRFSTPLHQNIGTISDDAALGTRTLDVSDAVDDDREREPDFQRHDGPTNPPEITISYRTR